YWKKAMAEGRPIRFTSSAGARYILRNVSTDELLKLTRDRAVDLEILFRHGVRDEFRRAALADLAGRDNKNALSVLIEAIQSQDPQKQKGSPEESVVFDLVRLLTDRPAAELARVRGELERMATGANLPVTRQLGFVALIAADGGVDRAWTLAVQSVPTLQ